MSLKHTTDPLSAGEGFPAARLHLNPHFLYALMQPHTCMSEEERPARPLVPVLAFLASIWTRGGAPVGLERVLTLLLTVSPEAEGDQGSNLSQATKSFNI